jgi:hypothetical protein
MNMCQITIWRCNTKSKTKLKKCTLIFIRQRDEQTEKNGKCTHDEMDAAPNVLVPFMKGEQVHRIGGSDSGHTRSRHDYSAVQESADRRDGSRFATAQVEKDERTQECE